MWIKAVHPVGRSVPLEVDLWLLQRRVMAGAKFSLSRTTFDTVRAKLSGIERIKGHRLRNWFSRHLMIA